MSWYCAPFKNGLSTFTIGCCGSVEYTEKSIEILIKEIVCLIVLLHKKMKVYLQQISKYLMLVRYQQVCLNVHRR